MPELPEVETIARYIRSSPLIGQRVTSARVFWEKTLALPESSDQFNKELAGRTLLTIDRRGKYLILNFQPLFMLVHLRMSGDLRIEDDRQATLTHDRAQVNFSNSFRLSFNDPRKFGRIWLVSDPASILSNLGLEPFDPTLTAECFYAALQRTKRRIKMLLLDQTVISGMGNIYTDEALHLAGLHPDEPANMIINSGASRLLQAIRQVLQEGIAHHGSSIDWVYRGGTFQNHFRVYQRTGQPCPVCGAAVERIIVGQRSTHFCPRCQVLSTRTVKEDANE